MAPPLKVVISGASSPVAYALVPLIAGGHVFGANQEICLILFEISHLTQRLNGLVMELQDSAFPLLRQVVPTTNPNQAFRDVQAAFMLDGHENSPHKEIKDSVFRNVEIFKERAQIINQYASRDCKVLVLSNPSNTNALVLAQFAPTIQRENFVALSRMVDNRTAAQLSERLNVHPSLISNIIAWGNNFTTITPDATHATVTINGEEKLLRDIIDDDEYLEGKLVRDVRKRFDEVYDAKHAYPALSTAKAAADQMRDWWLGTEKGKWISMAVVSNGGSYDVPMDIVFSFPVETCGKKWKVKRDLLLDEFVREDIKVAIQELLDEKAQAKKLLEF